MVPGFGHRLFEGWGKALLVAVLLMKPTYALALGITLGISSAITLGMSSLGFLLAFIVTGAFWWGLIGYRKNLHKHAGGHHAHAQQRPSDVSRKRRRRRHVTRSRGVESVRHTDDGCQHHLDGGQKHVQQRQALISESRGNPVAVAERNQPTTAAARRYASRRAERREFRIGRFEQ
jgi:hypothetical protein